VVVLNPDVMPRVRRHDCSTEYEALDFLLITIQAADPFALRSLYAEHPCLSFTIPLLLVTEILELHLPFQTQHRLLVDILGV
jgi:hypothetical protein